MDESLRAQRSSWRGTGSAFKQPRDPRTHAQLLDSMAIAGALSVSERRKKLSFPRVPCGDACKDTSTFHLHILIDANLFQGLFVLST